MRKKTTGILVLGMALALSACGKDQLIIEQPTVPESICTLEESVSRADSNEDIESESIETEVPESESVPEETVPVETVVEKEDEIVTITVSAAGDVTLGNLYGMTYEWSFDEMYELQSPEYFFESVKPIFEADDMTIVNFEGVLTLTNDRVEKKYNMKGDPKYVHILTAGDIEAVSFANNHRMDYSQQGSDDTVAAFESVDISYAYDSVVGYYETKGITIGFISFNEVYDGTAVEQFIKDGMAELREAEVDLILACCHWGSELAHYPEEYQTTLAHMCIDLGADLVIGHHPHVLQGVDIYNGKYIVYSLGNFCFGGNKNPKDKDSMIFQQTFTFINGEKQQDDNIKVIPVHISSMKNRNDYQPTPVEGEEAVKVIDRVNKYSEGFGLKFDYDGYLIKADAEEMEQ